MADEREQAMLAKSIDGFFLRSGLTAQDKKECYDFVEQLFPHRSVFPVPSQGYCSFTMLVGDSLIVQFRPEQYRLDLHITQAARDTYGPLAPTTKYAATLPNSRLFVYLMGRIGGISLQEFHRVTPRTRSSDLRARMCKDFARFLAKGWHSGDVSYMGFGTVGKSIRSRLELLSTELPVRFRPMARHVLKHLSRIKGLPWVLTHGDAVAGNIMLDPSSGHILGFVDWAEAERLPFGVGLYGLEELLGEMSTVGFEYYPDASDLRQIFWNQLIVDAPDLRQGRVLEAVKLAGVLGVLLWHGIAFDNGAIDRVVQEGKDVDEVFRLDAFLNLRRLRILDKISRL